MWKPGTGPSKIAWNKHDRFIKRVDCINYPFTSYIIYHSLQGHVGSRFVTTANNF